MKIVKCNEGHYYNSDNYSRCPICEERDQEVKFALVYASPEVMSGKYKSEENSLTEALQLYAAPPIEPITLAGIPVNYMDYESTDTNLQYADPAPQKAYFTVNSREMRGCAYGECEVIFSLETPVYPYNTKRN